MSTPEVICPYCGEPTALVDSAEVYGRSFGMIWLCRPCQAYVGTHGNSEGHKPLGTPANAHLRKYRTQAHAAFDPLWKSGRMTREKAYKVLRRVLQVSREQGHIGMLDIEQCKRLIEALKEEGK